ncbi:hypothetical protein [Treponema sp.]|uniref:LIC_12708 family protein n=1 Tax=Treponema sp. TaxID=166 RepID=UPI0025F6C17A|nr:hypothetical protein [Treponema sp.]MCR5219176.1 hypothetical protein [Treponema sp.]
MQLKNHAVIFALVLSSTLLSCNREKVVENVPKEELFSLNYGNFEDEINLFSLSDVGEINTSLVMHEGFFYIANGEAGKIMKMNSYGDLLTLYFNEETNPVPSVEAGADYGNATRKSISYPFNSISSIAVDSKQYLYVVDRLPPERVETDASTKEVLSQVVLRFDEEGNFLDYFGQQGRGALPFAYVRNIYVTNHRELVVICKSDDSEIGETVYWFSAEGFLVKKLQINNKNVPDPLAADGVESFVAVNNIVPGYKDRMLYISINYYKNYIDEASRVQSGIEYVSTYLYSLDVESGIFGDGIEVPSDFYEVSGDYSKREFKVPYEFMGVTVNGWAFYVNSVEQGLNIQMVQLNGQHILKRMLNFDRYKSLFYALDLSQTGVISALIGNKEKTTFCWWRTDSLIKAAIKN